MSVSALHDVQANDYDLLNLFLATRSYTEELCSPLLVEDYVIQSMEDVSPPKWHLAHTTWFFEELLLKKFIGGYREFSSQFSFIFNSYYNSLGEKLLRSKRGLLSRPSLEEVLTYRKTVTDAVATLWGKALGGGNKKSRAKQFNAKQRKALADLLLIGIHHEKQHQELLLTDIKYNFYQNPLYPVYHRVRMLPKASSIVSVVLQFMEVEGGLLWLGQNREEAFCYDNETPKHRVFCNRFRIANRLVTCREYLAFMDDGGYSEPRHWLADGWDYVQEYKCKAPLYWQKREGEWKVFTLSGFQPLQSDEPVCHLNYYEAQAYAHWCGKRLPTEIEWEAAAQQLGTTEEGHFADRGLLHPCAADVPLQQSNGLLQLLGDVWEWTSSSYLPYPGFSPLPGALEEYNGKFMCGQIVLRGGSCMSPSEHLRFTYRNFLQPSKSWQVSGCRMAEDV